MILQSFALSFFIRLGSVLLIINGGFFSGYAAAATNWSFEYGKFESLLLFLFGSYHPV